MFVWLFNEIIDLLLCQGGTFTVLLISIHVIELFVYALLITNIKYQSHFNEF